MRGSRRLNLLREPFFFLWSASFNDLVQVLIANKRPQLIYSSTTCSRGDQRTEAFTDREAWRYGAETGVGIASE